MRKDVPVSQFLDSMIARAKADKKTIVLPEGNDIRTLKAAEAILTEGIADLIVLGDADDITAASVIPSRISVCCNNSLKQFMKKSSYFCRRACIFLRRCSGGCTTV